jgi:hypothetical protein
LPELPRTPERWPRLDAGAVLCRTSEDLQRHIAAIVARLNGSNGAAAEPAGCRVIHEQTAVAVLARAGPGRTQVSLSDSPGETGWTDAFLPEKSGSP